MNLSSPIKIAIVGSGAVATAHLPIVDESPDFEAAVLVDKVLSRAEELCDQFGVPASVDNHMAIVGKVDAAIIALPHHLHAPVAVDLLEAGVHVLVEKPMALHLSDCDRMIEAAKRSGAVLAVGQLRRFFNSSAFIKQFLDGGGLGAITGFDMQEGSVYDWPVKSDFMFRRESGGGVLLDQGVHSLDILLWWLGDWADVVYYDDSAGGVEANCELHLKMASGAEGVVALSRTRKMRSTVFISGEKGSLEVDSQFDSVVRLRLAGQEVALEGKVLENGSGEEVWDIFSRQLADFGYAIRTGRRPLVSGSEGRRVVGLLEKCHQERRPLALPWLEKMVSE